MTERSCKWGCALLLALGVIGTTARVLEAADDDRVAATGEADEVHRQYFAEGATGYFETLFGLVNPSETETAHVSLQLLTDLGEQFTHQVTLAPRQRATIDADDVLGGLARRFAAIVESDRPVAGDRLMRWGGTAYGSSLERGIPAPSLTWHFAEGASGPFATFYLLLNPGTVPATVSIVHFRETGEPLHRTYTVPSQTRRTIWLDADPDLASALAGASVTSDVPIVVERAMYLTAGSEVFTAGAVAAGAPTPSDEWYFAEGVVGPFFDEFLLLVNPSPSPALAEIAFHIAGGAPLSKTYPIAPETRRTIWLNHEAVSDPALAALAGRIVSLAVTADQPIVAERAMWAPPTGWYENHTSGGATEPATMWSVPSGGTGGAANEQTYVLLFNPGSSAADVRVTLISDDGSTEAIVRPIDPHGRLTLDVGTTFNMEAPTFSLIVESLGDPGVPLVVEYVRYGSRPARPLASGAAALAVPAAPDTPPDDEAPRVTATTPAEGAADVPVDNQLAVRFNMPVAVTTAAFTLECPAGSPVSVTTASSSPAEQFILQPNAPLPAETACVLTVHADEVADADDPANTLPADRIVHFTTSACAPITISPETLDAGMVGSPYGPVTFTQDGATSAVTWTLAGDVPAGLSLSASGVLAGTPIEAGNFPVTVSLTDANNCRAERLTTLIIDCPAIVVGPAGPDLPNGQVGIPYAQPLTAAGGTPPHAFAVTSGTLPAGLTLTPDGALLGTPTAGGGFTFAVTASDTYQCTGAMSYALAIQPEANDAPVLTTDPISYATAGNTQLHVGGAALAGVAFAADDDSPLIKAAPTDPDGPQPLEAVPNSGTSANGGSFMINADGSFTYVPPVGFVGVDSFSYQITDSHPAIPSVVSGTIEITVSDVVWYVRDVVDGDNAAGGDGRSIDAFETLAAVEAASGPGNTIFIFRGDTETTPLDGGITLSNEQKLIGEGVGLTLPSLGTLVPVGLQPRITNTVAGGHGVTVLADSSNGNRTAVEIRGLEISGAVNAVHVASADAAELGVRVSESTIANAGLSGIAVIAGATSTAQTLALHDNIVTASGNGIDLLRVAGVLTITAFGNNTVTGATGGAGIVVGGSNVIFDADSAAAGFQTVAGGALSIGTAADPVGGAALLLESVSGDVTFTTIDLFAATGTALRVGGTGAYTGISGLRLRHLNPGTGVVQASAGTAVDLVALTLDLRLDTIGSTNSPGAGVSLVGLPGGSTIFSASNGSIANAAGTAFLIDGGNAEIRYSGSIANVAGRSVVVQNRSGGGAIFTSGISDTGTGILLTANATGTTTIFAGGLALTTTVNPAFTATGGGTLQICDENPCNPDATGSLVNTLSTTTATALNVTNTTIGASNLELRSVSAGTAASGPANGIVLNNTGSSGGLKIKGTGSPGTGGTIQRAAIGVSLTSTANVSLSGMQLNDFSDFAVRGDAVVNFDMADTIVNGTNGNDAGADEGSIRFTGLTGAATIASSSISGGLEDNVKLVNSAGTLDRLTFSNVTIGANSATEGNDGIGIEAAGSATVNVAVENSTFTSARGDLFQMSVPGTGGSGLIFTGNTLSNNHPGIATGGGGVTITGGNASAVTLDINTNTFRDAVGHAVLIVKTIGSGSLVGSFANNTIGAANDANSGSLEGDGLKIQHAGEGALTMTVTGNQVHQYNNQGIHLQAGAGLPHGGAFNVTLSGNTIANPGSNPAMDLIFQGLHLNNGVTPGDSFQTCVDIGPNVITGSGRNGGTDFRLRQRQDTTVRLPGYGDTPNDTALVVSFVQGNLAAAATGSVAVDFPTSGGGFIGTGTACPQP